MTKSRKIQGPSGVRLCAVRKPYTMAKLAKMAKSRNAKSGTDCFGRFWGSTEAVPGLQRVPSGNKLANIMKFIYFNFFITFSLSEFSNK